jgi:hypothetical protein
MVIKAATVDILDAGIIVNFDEETSVLFSAEFLYAHKNYDGNKTLPYVTDGKGVQ